jgi:Calcium binding
MSPVRRAAPALDELIAEITADCNDEDEVLMGFEGFFDEQAHFPCPGTILGENINVLSVAADDDRRELVATCQRNDRRYEIALLDIDIQADPPTSRLIAAYRRWVSA